jgi:hypothetical protein
MLEKINPTFSRAPTHKSIGKRIIVTNGIFKGYTGYVCAANLVMGTFLVDLVGNGKKNIATADLVYL